MKKINFCLFFTIMASWLTNAQKLDIYDIDPYETEAKDSFAFISLSDNYHVSEHPDSLTIPPSKNHLQVFKLDGKYRKQLLHKTKIQETDNVYIYDHFKDKLVTFKVSRLEAFACLTIYSSVDEGPFEAYEYMIGFKVDRKYLKDLGEYYSNSLVYIGKENPFAKGGIKQLLWKKIPPKDFPNVKMTAENEKKIHHYDRKIYTMGDVWNADADGYRFFLQDIIVDERIYARWLLVYNSASNQPVLDKMFVDSEGTIQAPLNYIDHEYPSVNQFAGKLFKNKPPVVFGFEYVSFGCPGITFLSASEEDLYINCDNRH
ncbi:oxidoreductase [Flavobacterium sp.]|uniref:oxidoreductase n=1 Tax=Flavobacterium sp. TaxID=239 RepID=UPI0040333267